MVYRLPVWVIPQVQGLASGFAILRGGRDERLIGGGEALLLAVQVMAMRTSVLAVRLDAITAPCEFVYVLAVALRSNKAWPMAYCAVVLVSLMTVVVELFAPVDKWAYGTAGVVWNILESLVLVIGTWRGTRAAAGEALLAASIA